MRDLQSEKDFRNVPLNRVGIKNLRYPVEVLDQKAGRQKTVANISMFVDLPGDLRGTHLSRFVELVHRHKDEIGVSNLASILEDIKEAFGSRDAYLELAFPYFIEKQAPVTGERGLLEYRAFFAAYLSESYRGTVGVSVPVTTLCPCSKEISAAGAHNQRSLVGLWVEASRFVWFEELIALVEEKASSELFSLLKREDEKFVTEKAYANPRFVEDLVREITLELEGDEEVSGFRVEVESLESIHNHNAYALVERGQVLGPASTIPFWAPEKITTAF
ncbi:MAG TPA: GTP cyclohydrolase FolE2 [candidate division Zixibacteria bacterium]|nr:GTP cyclohydrolase FolE2 [candidate division Zixibacteria bacterium]